MGSELPPLAGEDQVCAECGLEYPMLEPAIAGTAIERIPQRARSRVVLDELSLCVGGFLDELARIRAGGRGRTAYRLTGEIRTARWLVRNAAHEGVHHVMDIERLGTSRG